MFLRIKFYFSSINPNEPNSKDKRMQKHKKFTLEKYTIHFLKNHRTQYSTGSEKHSISTVKQPKVALNTFGDER